MMVSKTFYVDTSKNIDILLITHEIRRAVSESRPEIGQVTVIIPFPGAAVVIMPKDVSREVMAKELSQYLKNQLIECLLPKSVVIPLEKGKLVTEPWQEVFLIDFDTLGRRRELRVSVSSETGGAAAKPGAPGASAAPQPGGR